MLNIDELSARVKCLRREHVIILAEVIKLYIASLKNKKFIIIVKTIIADKRKPLPPFVIAPKKQIIDNWINNVICVKSAIRVGLVMLGIK